MAGKKARKKAHRDCPFTMEEVYGFESMIYSVNTSFPCINPVGYCVRGFQYVHDMEMIQDMKAERARHDPYMAYVEEMLE